MQYVDARQDAAKHIVGLPEDDLSVYHHGLFLCSFCLSLPTASTGHRAPEAGAKEPGFTSFAYLRNRLRRISPLRDGRLPA